MRQPKPLRHTPDRPRNTPGSPLYGYKGPEPATVALGLPIGDFKPMIECVYGILQCMPFFARPIDYCGCSLVNEARNRIAHKFLHNHERNLEWLFWIDSDIGFTTQDWCYMTDTDEPLVVAPYAKKSFDNTRVDTGFGFVKVHRKVFNAIAALLNEDGSERVPRFFHSGELHVDYFPVGATGNGQWCGEDAGFFAWAGIAGFPYRIEERCDLIHYGRHGYRLRRGTEHPLDLPRLI